MLIALLGTGGASAAGEAAAATSGSTQQLTLDEALRVAFPAPATIERRTAFLGEEQLQRAQARAGRDVPIGGGVVTYYLGRRDGVLLGAAYFDRHRVRTLDEVVMVVVAPEGDVRQVEVLRFAEPPDYAAPPRWLDQLRGRRLNDDLSHRGGVVNLTGATLTAQALVRATRRVLALHHEIHGEEATPGRDRRR